MATKWTDEQQQAIDLRNCSILVSASAGSGKTAVLTERILQKIMDAENPVNIDEMIVVTFTRAAAGEMKERIRQAIEKQAAKHPDNVHLQKQKTLIHHANITTIDSFCKMIIQNHFEEIDLDPSFRIADTGEVNLMKKEAIEELLEDYYKMAEESLSEEASEEEKEKGQLFYHFMESFAGGKNDKTVENLILNVYEFSMSYPFPEQWLDACKAAYHCHSVEELENKEWMKTILQYCHEMFTHGKKVSDSALELCLEPGGPYMYEEAILYYQSFMNSLCEADSYVKLYEKLEDFEAPSLSAKRDKDVDGTVRERVKGMRDECLDIITDIKKEFFFQSPEQMATDLHGMQAAVGILIELAKSYITVYGRIKRKKDLVDFHDIEHFALNILVDEEGNPTETAKRYAKQFDEIMIDEYQDSNHVQELLMTSISKKCLGKENLFMVGDAKQSIYRFRLARPEIFVGKYNRFTEEESPERKVSLFRNFRSRKEVLYTTNYIFEKIMQDSLGGIRYDKDAALYVGASYQEPKALSDYESTVLLYDTKNLKEQEEKISGQEFEATMIANRIKQLVNPAKPLYITDKQTGEYRPCQYKDIKILVRGMSGVEESFVPVFKREGIPLYLPSRAGYFDTLEIDTVLNLLRIIDNPLQDIPLAAVLKSPIGNFTDEELAKLRVGTQKMPFYQSLCSYVESDVTQEQNLVDKVVGFLNQLQDFRKQVHILPLHEFIWYLLDETGYGDVIVAMPAGEQRRANMEVFVQKAMDYEKTSYIGVFQFVQYIEQLKKYNVEEGEASVITENDNTVWMMTIHKSKGLEFPVVFVAGLGKQMNTADEKQEVMLHPDLGLGVNAINVETREKSSTILRNLLKQQNRLERLGEELRVLYVAMTRAKEKLFLVGSPRSLSKTMEKSMAVWNFEGPDFYSLSNALSYLDWILSVLVVHPAMGNVLCQMDIDWVPPFTTSDWEIPIQAELVTYESLFLNKLEEAMIQEEKQFIFEQELQERKERLSENLELLFSYQYPYQVLNEIPAKLSVSEIKLAAMAELEESEASAAVMPGVQVSEAVEELTESVGDSDVIESDELQGQTMDELPDDLLPEFLKKEKQELLGSDRGTAYHRVFELLDYSRGETIEQVQKQIDEMFEKEFLEEHLKPVVKARDFHTFLQSPVGQRMKVASEANLLRREQPFVIGIQASEVYEKVTDERSPLILVQGIIDAFFVEDGELVVVDYKTDAVCSAEELIARYRTQLAYYAKALEQLTGMPVKEQIIYSTRLQKEIKIG